MAAGLQTRLIGLLAKNLENAGLVEVGYGGVELVDAAGLASLLDDT